MKSRAGVLLCALSIIVFSLPACGALSSAFRPAEKQDSTRYLVITTPVDGIICPIGDITIKVKAAGVEMVNGGSVNLPGQGHLMYYIDSDRFSSEQQTTLRDTCVMTSALTYTWPDVPAGQHTFVVEMVNNDNTPLFPPVTDSVEIIVVAGKELLNGFKG